MGRFESLQSYCNFIFIVNVRASERKRVKTNHVKLQFEIWRFEGLQGLRVYIEYQNFETFQLWCSWPIYNPVLLLRVGENG